MSGAAPIEISYCVVNTSQCELLMRCLDAIAREQAALACPTEILVLDNCSADGSAAAARAHVARPEVIELGLRRGKAENDSTLMQRASGRYCLLLNEDAELEAGATKALHAELEDHPEAAVAAAALRPPHGPMVPSAWRFPSPAVALAGAVFLHRWLTVQSAARRSAPVREVDWAQSSAMLVRRVAAEQIGWMDPDFFVYSDEVDFCRRLRNAGWSILHVPHAVAIHHEQLAGPAIAERRIVEFSRNRDRYLRKHHTPAAARIVRWLTAWSYAVRALVAPLLPGHQPRRYWLHVRATLCPDRGEGVREAAAAYNRAREQSP